MPSFKYLAVDKSGKPMRAAMHANSESEVAASLTAQGLTVVNVEEEGKLMAKRVTFAQRGIGLQDKINLTRHLSIMIQAGLPLVPALDVLQKDLPNKKLQSVLAEARGQLEAGKTFSETLARYPQYFDETFIAILQAGEVSGKLAEVLQSLAAKFEQDQEIRAKITSALMYPIVVVFGLVLVGLLMITFVVPKVTSTFERMDMTLPITLRMMAAISKIVAYNYFLSALVAVGGLLGAIFFIRWFWHTKARTKITNRLPVVSQLLHLLDLTTLTSTLALLLESGVPIIRAIHISVGPVTDLDLKNLLLKTEEGMRSGKSLADGLRQAPKKLIPPLLIQIVEVGERTGQLHKVLRQVSGFYGAEVTNRLKNLASLIEPILMLVIGAAVGVMVVSIIAPIYKLVGQVGK